VQRLLAEGAEVDARDGRGDTALLVAAGHGHAAVVQALLEAGADVHAENGVGENAWVRAVTFKQEEAEAALKADGARTDVDRMAEYMMRLEDFAAALREGALDRVRLPLESGAVDIDGLVGRTHTPLILAVYQGDEAMARMLLEVGADPDIPNADGVTPLIVAVRTNQWAFVPLLLAAGAAVDAAAPGGVTSLLLAAGEGHAETVALLLAAGADPQRGNADGVTPLMQAAAAGSEEVVRLLLESGADPHRCDSQGANAAAWAASYEHPNLVRLLRQEDREMKRTIDDELRVTALEANLEKRLGFGRLQAAAWLDDRTVLVATRAALWRWSPGAGTVAPFANLGPGLLSVNRPAGLAAVSVECPEREMAVLSLDDGRVVRRLPGHGGGLIKSLALSPDGRLLASGGSDRMLRVREVASGEELLVLEHPGGFSSMDGNPDVVAWAPDGTRLATADNEKRLWLWDVTTGVQMVEVQLPLSARALAFSPDGATLVAGLEFGGGTISRDDRFLAVLDGRTGELLHLPDTPSEDDDRGENVWAVAFSPDGRFCAVGDDEGSLRSNGAVHIFDTTNWQRVVHLPGSRHRLEARRHITLSGLAYAPDGTCLLVVSGSEVNRGTVTVEYALQLWDTRSWEPVARLDDFVGTANDLSLLPDESVLVATDEGLRHYTGDEGYTTLLTGNVHRVAAAPDGKHAVVAYASFKGEARLLDLESGKVGELLPAITKERINSVAFAADSLHYVVCHSDCWVRKVGRKTALRRMPRELVLPRNRLTAAASLDGKLAIVSWQGTLSLLWGDRFEQMITRSHPGPARRLNGAAFAPDGQRVAAASGFHRRGIESEDRRGRVFVWQLPEMEARELLTPQEERWFESVAWSPDGALIAAGTRNGVLCLFDAQSGEFLGELLVHGAVITAVQFTPDGGHLVTASEDGSAAVVALRDLGSTA
jgi:ankyrin repeat protein/WD40 repeat protein